MTCGRRVADALAIAVALLLSDARATDEVTVTTSQSDTAPYVLVLGTAQDAGSPQVGCDLMCCVAARRDPARRRLVASALLVEPIRGRRFLLDATPDLREQVERARGHGRLASVETGRPPLFDGVFLTHAHMGHYSGLLQLGHEAYGSRGLPLMVAPGMARFLRDNDPWRHALELGTYRIEPLEFDKPYPIDDQLSVTAIQVPHRDEFSDTAAFRIQGPRRALLFLPDIDKWERLDAWGRRIEDEIAKVDVALLDGSFYAEGEIEGRAMASIPHPFIQESIDRFAALPARERAKIRFFHLNHTNPATNEDSEAAAAVRKAGMAIAADLERHDL